MARCFASGGGAIILRRPITQSKSIILKPYLFTVIGSQFTVFSMNYAKIEAFWILIICKLFSKLLNPKKMTP